MATTIVKDGQTLFDIAIQSLGNVDRVFDLAQANDLGINDELTSGQLLSLPDVEFADKDTSDYFTTPWYPMGGDADNEAVPGGIGYMQIGTNFKSS